MDFKEWVDKYKPISLDKGYLETYGQHLERVKSVNPKCVWTVCNWGEGDFYISGFRVVNRVGYVICEVPYEEEDYEMVQGEDDGGWVTVL